MSIRPTNFLVVIGGMLLYAPACVNCPTGQFPVNFQCRAHDCPEGTKPESLQDGSIQCLCPAGEQWVGGKCISVCAAGQTWGVTGNCCRPMSGGTTDIDTCVNTPPPDHNVAVGPHRM